MATANGRVTLRVRALPLPAAVAGALSDNCDLLRSAVASSRRPQPLDGRPFSGERHGSGGANAAQPSGGSEGAGGAAELDADRGRSQGGAAAPAADGDGGHDDDGSLGVLRKRSVPSCTLHPIDWSGQLIPDGAL